MTDMLSEHGSTRDRISDEKRREVVALLLSKIRHELDSDKRRKKPLKVGYTGTDQMMADEMNKPRPELDADGKPTGRTLVCRTCVITSGVPYAPNALSADHIAAAKALPTDTIEEESV